MRANGEPPIDRLFASFILFFSLFGRLLVIIFDKKDFGLNYPQMTLIIN